MTYTEEQKHQIVTLRGAGVPWKTIGQALKKNLTALRVWWSRFPQIAGLPPKPKIDKSLTRGRDGLQIKNIVNETPRETIRSIPGELGNRFSPGNPILFPTTIH
jgi:hypothetical protein